MGHGWGVAVMKDMLQREEGGALQTGHFDAMLHFFFTSVDENLVRSECPCFKMISCNMYMLQRKVGLGLYKQDTATLTHRFIHFSNSNNVIVFRV